MVLLLCNFPIQLNPSLTFGVRHLAFDCCDLQVAESVSKDFLNECGGVDSPFAECFADVPAEVHQVNAFFNAEPIDTGDTSHKV